MSLASSSAVCVQAKNNCPDKQPEHKLPVPCMCHQQLRKEAFVSGSASSLLNPSGGIEDLLSCWEPSLCQENSVITVLSWQKPDIGLMDTLLEENQVSSLESQLRNLWS